VLTPPVAGAGYQVQQIAVSSGRAEPDAGRPLWMPLWTPSGPIRAPSTHWHR